MARIRTLKPEALQHRKVGRLSDRAFRLWIGLITQADDEGRLIVDPEQYRALFFGYHARTKVGDVIAALDEVAATGLIIQYEHEGVRYLAFPSWKDHQRINRPSESALPGPRAQGSVIVHGAFRERSVNGHGEITEDSVTVHSLARARGSDRIGSEGIGGDRIGREGIGGEGTGEGTAAAAGAAPTPAPEPAWGTVEALVALYNAAVPPELPRVQSLSPARRRKAAAALRLFPTRAFWDQVFREYGQSAFLRGLQNGPGHESFRADFDWLLAKGKDGTENVVKIHDGKYRDQPPGRAGISGKTARTVRGLQAWAAGSAART
ncbi:MAG TPA: hypothetical protein VFE48_25505 [Methylomirabilota bacterium]|nr:hypothetical protein [Methylomirabilota bacterium]